MIFFKGILVGLLMAVPVGPVGILCIERALLKGRRSGFLSGLGAATADGLYAAVGAFGLTIISSFITQHDLIIRLVGGAFILYLGLNSLFGKEHVKMPRHNIIFEKGNDYVSTFLLTLTNPSTIVTFGIVFTLTGFDPNAVANLLVPTLLVIGVAAGSALWWFALSYGVTYIAPKIPSFSLDLVKKLAGILIIIFALIILSGLRF